MKLVGDVLREPRFVSFAAAFEARGVRTWSTIEERALQYGLANRHAPGGVIVELGSYCGGSAAFFAKGLADKRNTARGRVVCVDPLLGAPPWLPLPPHMFTLAELRGNIDALGLSAYVDLKIGESAAVGSIWPAEPIDVLLIDGDHSFEGALRDLECWAPKLRDGGVLLFDDVDHIPQMRAIDEIMTNMTTLLRSGAIGGTAVYVVRDGGGWQLIDELRRLLDARGIHRPWSFDAVHASPPAGRYRSTKLWTDHTLELAYDLGYLSVADGGDYAALDDCPTELVRILMSLHADRSDGDLHLLVDTRRYRRNYRVIACRPERAAEAAALLIPGGVLLAWSDVPMSPEEAGRLDEIMRSAGLDGVGHGAGHYPLFWGVAGIAGLSAQATIRELMKVRTAPAIRSATVAYPSSAASAACCGRDAP